MFDRGEHRYGVSGKVAYGHVAVATVLPGEQLVLPLSIEWCLPQEWVTDETGWAMAASAEPVRVREVAHGRYPTSAACCRWAFDSLRPSLTVDGRVLPAGSSNSGCGTARDLLVTTMCTAGARRAKSAARIAAQIPEPDHDTYTPKNSADGSVSPRVLWMSRSAAPPSDAGALDAWFWAFTGAVAPLQCLRPASTIRGYVTNSR